MNNIDLFGNEIIKDELLRDRFMEPPFSVLDSKNGNWQRRKRLWKQKGIKSEIGRNVKVINNTFTEKYGREGMPEESIFDPALTELLYYWYCPTNGKILDPFAGGSVRGIVANYMQYFYTGIDIRQEQIDANIYNALEILPYNNQPKYYVGDSNVVLDEFKENSFDFVFSCPPYSDLEIYSDLNGDISNMNYECFLSAYDSIIKKSIKCLKKDCYAVFVVSDIRDKKGFYRDFVSSTKKCFIDAGAMLYSEAVLLQPLGTAMLRANRTFSTGKLVKVHENVLIFKKI
jgi:DNA modification methylase